MNTWFPNGAAPSNRDIIYAYYLLPYHVRFRILTALKVAGKHYKEAEALRLLRECNQFGWLLEMVRDETVELEKYR